MDHSCANYLPRDLPQPIHNSHRLVTDGEVNDRLRLGATFRHDLELTRASRGLEHGEKSHLFSQHLSKQFDLLLPATSQRTHPTATHGEETPVPHMIWVFPEVGDTLFIRGRAVLIGSCCTWRE